MERLIYSDLLKWKHNANRKPLILNGARQVGKTWILKEFGRREYEKTAYINCEKAVQIEEVFGDFDSSRMVTALSVLSGVDIIPEKTLVFIDEVQEYPRALTALKYFCEDAPRYHIVVAGSLLGISLHQGVSFPVGKVDVLNLFPMTLTEFVLALGNKQAAEMLQNGDMKTASSINSFFIEMLRKYYYVGGMPAAVKEFAENGKPNEVRKIQKQILSDYRRDFSKHTSRSEAERIAMVWDAIPQQLAKENKKFKYSDVKQGSRANDFLTSIQWLMDAGLIYKITRINKSARPLRFYEEPSVFKLFLNDVGLLAAQYGGNIQTRMLSSNPNINFGAIFENLAAQELYAHGFAVEHSLYYFNSKKQGELDFVVEHQGEALPIEVKSGKDFERHRALSNIMDNDEYAIPKAFVFCQDNIQTKARLVYLPIYMLMFFQHDSNEDLTYRINLTGLK